MFTPLFPLHPLSASFFSASQGAYTFLFFRSVASVALVGSGADEVFGGYMRHRHAYDKGDRDAVIDGLEEELRVIGRRNLGRDDRVTLGHGRNIRWNIYYLCLADSFFIFLKRFSKTVVFLVSY